MPDWIEESARATSESAQRNIETIVRLEQEALRKRSASERVSDRFVRFMGSMTFVVLHLALFLLWFGINSGLIPGIRPFDPFPFGILTLIVSAEGVLLAIFVLVSQNSMTRQANQRDHLNLQISLLAEQETTKVLQRLQQIADAVGVRETEADQEAERLSQQTHLETLAEEIEKSLPRG
jgi:uncharacterized membrane protein